jgi:putative endonuclease
MHQNTQPFATRSIHITDNPENWCVYIIQCSDNSLYTGISNNVDRRFYQHVNQQGAKYFRGRHPNALVYVENGHNRKTASQREFAIKRLSRQKKLQLIATAIKNQIEL